ncbi:UNVERIFIED_CONTAM: rhoptry kinase family protein ROP31, putative [Hammondia hammondi]|eukprot:XP_008883128.1 rhoptry kinase family protein ROP31, putative [Hammondia hammondi]
MFAFTIYFLWCGHLPWGIAIEEGDYGKIVAIFDQNMPETLNFHNCNGIPTDLPPAAYSAAPSERPPSALDARKSTC